MKNALIQRTLVFICGLFIMAIGVGLSVKANLGVSPISSVPYVYSLKFPLTLGQTTIILNILLIGLQMLLLRKNYQWMQLIQIPVVLLFGWFIDLTLPLMDWIEPTQYLSQAWYCLLGCVVLALGVFFEIKAKVTYLPGEGVAMALNRGFAIEFGKAKIGVDSSLVIVAVISSLMFLGKVQGIREGTVAAALLVGYFVRLYNKALPFPKAWQPQDSPTKQAAQEAIPQQSSPSHKCTVTISRELGSGGHAIGKLVAQQLGIAFYDEALIQLTAEQSGFTKKYIQEHEQQLANSLFYLLYEQNYAYTDEVMPPLDGLFMVQSKIIRDINEKESCVIVGRCADFVLKDCAHCFSVFIHAEIPFRQQQIMQRYQVEPDEALKMLEASDRKRSNYCRRFTGKEWGAVRNYNLALQSSSLGIEQAADMLVQAIRQKMGT
nr:cytidylate kinase family protein [uncultured Desulfobulbus sp.]